MDRTRCYVSLLPSHRSRLTASNSLAELCQLVCGTHMALHIPYLLLLIALALIDLPPRLMRAARRDDPIEQA